MKHILIPAALLALLGAGLNAQTVTVAKSGTPDFATVQAAIDSFDPDPNGAVANVIQITDSAVYDEIITIDVPVTIEGTGVDRPILALQSNTGSDGIVISIPTGTINDVTLRNLIMIPSLTAPPNGVDVSDAIISAGQNLNILIDNCVVTANDGADNPVTLDGLTQVDLTGATVFGDDGMFLGPGAAPAGDGTSYTLVDTVISHVGDPASNADGLVCSGTTGGEVRILDGCVISYMERLGIQGNGDFAIDAPNDHVLILGNRGFAGIWFAGGAGTSRDLNGVDVIGTTGSHNSVAGWGIEQQTGVDLPLNISNAIIAQNAGEGLVVGGVGTTGAITISDVTFSGNGAEAIQTDPAATSPITLTDAILKGGTGILHDGTGTFDITFSALIGQAIGGASAGSVTQSNVITDSINFFDSSSPGSPDFYDIVLIAGDNSSPYLTAASDGGVLTGGAGSEEITITGVPEYQLYR